MKLLLISLFIWLNACTHIQPVAYDTEANTVSISGGKFASMPDYEDAAREQCHSQVKLVSMSQGSAGQRKINGNISMNIKRTIYTFSCLNR